MWLQFGKSVLALFSVNNFTPDIVGSKDIGRDVAISDNGNNIKIVYNYKDN